MVVQTENDVIECFYLTYSYVEPETAQRICRHDWFMDIRSAALTLYDTFGDHEYEFNLSDIRPARVSARSRVCGYSGRITLPGQVRT